MHRTAIVVLGVVILAQMSYRPPVVTAPVVLAPERPPVIVVIPPPISIAVVPAAAPAPAPPAPPDPAPSPPPVVVPDPDRLGPCPAPYTRGSDVAVTAPDGFDVDDVITSPRDVRLLAVWNEDDVRVSVDEGRTWRRVLSHEGGVADATFDCHGRLHVLRGDGLLGTHDDADVASPERWVRAAALITSEYDSGRLVPDGTGVAVIGVDPARRTRLLLARRDSRGRWRAAPLFEDTRYGSWDGVSIERVEPRRDGRVHMIAAPYQGGECGYGEYFDVTFDLALRHVRVASLGEELPPAAVSRR